VAKRLAVARNKDPADVRKSRLKLSTVSTPMRGAKKHHRICGQFDRLPMFKVAGGRRIAGHEQLDGIDLSLGNAHRADITNLFNKDTSETVREEDDRPTSSLLTTLY
jgi:hypothetical protein